MIILLLYFLSFFPHNNPSLDKIVDAYLTKASSSQEIKSLLNILDEKAYLFFDKFNKVPSINPLNPKNQKKISSTFGNRFHPIDKHNKKHLGIDISAKAGTPIHAAAEGIILKTIISKYGYGNQVYIEHEYGFSSRYAHMYVFIVQKGQSVKKGEIIGFVGSTGKSTGNHIHFEIHKNKKHLNPFPFINLRLPGD